jgi:hypothetical protein
MFGFKGADFTATRRPRMIRQEYSLLSFVVCALAGLAIIAPLIPYALASFVGAFIPLPTFGPEVLAICLAASAAIAIVFTTVFYKLDIENAKDLIRKAES